MGVSAVEWPKQIREEEAAEAAGRRAEAMLVIWGEYDSGRVIARFTAPDSRSERRDRQVVDIATTPAELPATINIGLTEEVRYVALLTLGQLRLEQGKHRLAKAALIRALTKPPADTVRARQPALQSRTRLSRRQPSRPGPRHRAFHMGHFRRA